jgi:TPR repeat protein
MVTSSLACHPTPTQAQNPDPGEIRRATELCTRRVPLPTRDPSVEPVTIQDLSEADDLPGILDACLAAHQATPENSVLRRALGRVLVASRDRSAVPYLQAAAEHREPDIFYLVFEAYVRIDRGSAGPEEKSAWLFPRGDAEDYLRAAAAEGQPEALVEIGRRQAEGKILRRDPAEARHWLAQAMTARNHPSRIAAAKLAWMQLILHDPTATPEEKGRAFRFAEELSADGFVAKAELAHALRFGIGTERDAVRARAILDDLVKEGFSAGAVPAYLAEMLIAGEGGPREPKRALALLTAPSGAVRASSESMALLARLHLEGGIVGRDPAKAVRILAPLSSRRESTIYRLAEILARYDFKLEPMWIESLRFALQEQADAGSAQAMVAFAKLKLASSRDFSDEAGAYKLLEAAAAEGSDQAKVLLALRYARWSDSGIAAVAEEVKSDLSALMAKGVASAYTAYGQLLRKGRVYPQDDVGATQAFLKAAEGGDPEAMVLVAEAYESGLGITKDRKEQLRWLRAAARLDSLQARRRLAWMANSIQGDVSLREGVTEAIALNADQPSYAVPISITPSTLRHNTVEEIAEAVLDGFRLAPAGLNEERMLGIVRQLPPDIRIEMERHLAKAGQFRGHPQGHFGPEARAALRVWVDAKGPLGPVPATTDAKPAIPAGQVGSGDITLPKDLYQKVYQDTLRLAKEAKTPQERRRSFERVNDLARFGDPTARWSLVGHFDNDAEMPKAISASDITRYTLDLLLTNSPNMPKLEIMLIFNTTAVINKQRQPKAFATAFIETVMDDRRLQKPATLDMVLEKISFAPLACEAIAQTAIHDFKVPGMSRNGCDKAAREALLTFAKERGPVGTDVKHRMAARETIKRLASRL